MKGESGKQILTAMLNLKGEDIKIVEEVLMAAPKNKRKDREVMVHKKTMISR